MRNLIVSLFLIGTLFFALTANAAKTASNNGSGITAHYDVVDAQTSMLVKNNVKHGFFGEPSAVLVFNTGVRKIEFNVYTKVEADGKLFLIGKGNHNVNIICIDGDNVCVPVASQRKMLINSKAFSNYIMSVCEDVPEDYGHFKAL